MEEDDEIGVGVAAAAAEANKLSNHLHHLWPSSSSRIVRVSRASGGKDRHSKVMTSKGLRDRRVRLSVATAIQFYDLQDRLGFDQPSKAVEWLINAASDAISELPSLNRFPFAGETTEYQQKQKKKKKRKENDGSVSVSASACSSNSETSRGSGLSLSRNEIRVKARERARERAAKEKEMSHSTASFTELLNGGGEANNNPNQQNPNLLNFNNEENFSSFMSDSHPQDYNMLNFSICSSSSGYNRGTLQSNCSLLPPPHMHQRFQPFDGSSSANSNHNFPLFVGSAIPMENHHLQFSPLFDARLHSDHKPKPKH